MSSSIDINQRMELETLDNLDKEQNSFLESTLGKVIDNEFITTDYDDIVIQLFKPYISIDYSYDSYFDELEDRRKSFYF